MRRRTNAGLTALQAALSGIGGGFAGYAKDTETRKADAERERLQREREEERTYNREMGLAGLLQQGFTTPEQFTTQRAAAGPDVANYVSQSVRSMMPGSTAAPPDPALMQRVLDTAGGNFREGQRLTIGGRELVLPESTPQRQDRLAALARGEARNAAQVAAQQRAEDQAREDRQLAKQAEAAERLARIRASAPPAREESPERIIAAELIRARRTPVSDDSGGQRFPNEQEMTALESDLRRYYGLDRAPNDDAATFSSVGSSTAAPINQNPDISTQKYPEADLTFSRSPLPPAPPPRIVVPGVRADVTARSAIDSFDAWMAANPPTAEERANPMLYKQRFEADRTGRR